MLLIRDLEAPSISITTRVAEYPLANPTLRKQDCTESKRKVFVFHRIEHSGQNIQAGRGSGCLSRGSRSTTDEDYESDFSDGGAEVITIGGIH